MSFRPVYIALGANQDDPERQLTHAVGMLRSLSAFRNIRVSSLKWTAPVGPVAQPNFLNGVVAAESDWEPECILWLLHCIEATTGRHRSTKQRWGPRPLDLDLLMVGDVTRTTKSLRLPHPEMRKRPFVIKPLNELAPDAVHPETGKTIRELMRALCD